ncbi:fumarylacetoacetate hydrolase family protein [Vibrio sp. S11_S32]|uniref:fumarylacetoacetate hydrolase family protein n=1 Tax=Vibrio sp. S11_S32 TaxID=2720225 RepID=UPI001681496F|nr:fumarylacetoacetate hydrolase family protein [Vibrio sp. S11_S32]MBD1577200.1 fumarylacetoacetate hydrolase family protein [Vibrio sp. S11_S32]
MNNIIVDGKKIKPSKVVCVGRNYAEHIKELNNVMPDEMVVFNKPNSAISATLTSLHQEPLHYEGEICFVIKSKKIHAVGFGLDLTKRQLQSKLKGKQLPWERAKAFNGAAVLSQFVSISNGDWQGLSLELLINGVKVQAGGVNQMLYTPDHIVQEVLSYSKLENGDVIMTGTPSGVGVVHQGDIFTGRIKQYEHVLLEAQWVAE